MSIVKLVGTVMFTVGALALQARRRQPNPQIQSLFERFHEAIKLEENDERRKLREKKEVLLKSVKEKLALRSLSFESFDQGSYAMRTGVVPKDGNYDIDVGLIFDCPSEQFKDPVVLKCLVRQALSAHNRTVRIRRACVTVTYVKKGEPQYHVDLALYVKGANGQLLLAKGKEFSEPQHREWAPSAPQELTAYVLSQFKGDDQAQFRRCIRYLKRWRDENFRTGAPLSIALTLAAAFWFKPARTSVGTPSDLEALLSLVKTMLGNFGHGTVGDRLAVQLPGPVTADLMKSMTDAQMLTLGQCLKRLQLALEACLGDVSVNDSAGFLAAQFGSDFPRPN